MVRANNRWIILPDFPDRDSCLRTGVCDELKLKVVSEAKVETWVKVEVDGVIGYTPERVTKFPRGFLHSRCKLPAIHAKWSVGPLCVLLSCDTVFRVTNLRKPERTFIYVHWATFWERDQHYTTAQPSGAVRQ